MGDDKEKHMSFLEHLEELRWTVIWIAVATVVGMGVVWHFSDQVIDMLGDDLTQIVQKALGEGKEYRLHVFEVSEAFTTKIKISLLLGFLLALPFNLYKIWQFLSPGLLRGERRLLSPLIVLSTVLFYAGVVFAYMVMVKLSVAFLFKLKPPSVEPTVRMGSYVTFVSKFCITFGLVFQVPLVLALLSMLGVITPQTIKGTWRYAVVIVVIISAFLTPPDVLSQLLMAIPVLLLYLLGYFLAVLFQRRPLQRSGARRNGNAGTS
jgi:sec-independent protein translocase protein TatC